MTAFAAPYVGRFAPSPTGTLHFGSLLAALASYLDAHHHQGQWLVRMEDLDPPREQPGAAAAILATLERFGLHWHGTALYQSRRGDDYRTLIETLLTRHEAYRCDCSRQQVAGRTAAAYDGHCRGRQQRVGKPAAIRIAAAAQRIEFQDRIQGPQSTQLVPGRDDFVIFRRDGFCAYQLAVVADDALQGITHVVRGSDLLDSTPRQRYLQQILQYAQPIYAHIPVMVNRQGQKLSKQTFAAPLDGHRPQPTLISALRVLGQQPPPCLADATVAELLRWAVVNWRLERVPSGLSVPDSLLNAEG